MKQKRKLWGGASLQKKLAAVFTVILGMIMTVFIGLYMRSIRSVRNATYENMRIQSQHYLEFLENMVQNARQKQIEFFNNRKLVMLTWPDTVLSDYERRDVLLFMQEQIKAIAGSGNMVEDGILYLSGNGYRMTSNGIWEMTPEDREKVEEYIAHHEETLYFDGENYYAVQTGEAIRAMEEQQDAVLVVVFSTKQIEQELSALGEETGGGAFIYQEQHDIMLQNDGASGFGRDILQALEKEEDGKYREVQEVSVGGKKYLVCVGGRGSLGVFVQYMESGPLMRKIRRSRWYMIGALALMIVLVAVFILYTRKTVHRPMKRLMEAFEEVRKGNLEEHIYHEGGDEFSYIYESFNEMEDELKRLIDEIYIQKELVTEARFKQLQAQINPHFLYNSFFILNGRIQMRDYENAQMISKHLGEYFRYITRNDSFDQPLSEEVSHARSYAAIQGTRFTGRVNVEFGELPGAQEERWVPRLILQPLLENAFGHGLKNKIEDGLLRISFREVEKEFQILVEDNGDETDDQILEAMRNSLDGEEVTGLVNIHRRLQLYFKGQAGLRIDRSGLGGVAVIMYMPLVDVE